MPSPPADHAVRFSYGGSLNQPEQDRWVSSKMLRQDPKWTRYPFQAHFTPVNTPVLGDFFRIKRGLVTGHNRYFILPEEEIVQRGLPRVAFRPILPSPRYLVDDHIVADTDGNPVLDRNLFLLDCRWDEQAVAQKYPTLWAYLEEGKAQGVADQYLCRHRTPWYVQEQRPAAPFVCTYLGRSDKRQGRPFRFILNESQATAANVYLMLYPQPPLDQVLQHDRGLKQKVWQVLHEICPQSLLGEGRVYGGGLHKLEPKELGNVPAPALADLLPITGRLFL